MVTHSNTLAWKIPWTEESGSLQPMGSQRVRHCWATKLNLNLFISEVSASFIPVENIWKVHKKPITNNQEYLFSKISYKSDEFALSLVWLILAAAPSLTCWDHWFSILLHGILLNRHLNHSRVRQRCSFPCLLGWERKVASPMWGSLTKVLWLRYWIGQKVHSGFSIRS